VTVESLPLPRPPQPLTDEDIVSRVLAGETAFFELIMRRYNQRIFRVARSITRDDDEAQDVTQQTYLSAYASLQQFAGEARFSTWLTRIAINAALARASKRERRAEVALVVDDDRLVPLTAPVRTPEEHTIGRELQGLIEGAVDRLPELYRVVFMMREVQQLDVAETSTCLDISEANVKVRLHRAKAMLRDSLCAELDRAAEEAFPFLGARCDEIVVAVMAQIG
jgi:RNA polymerase sigma-70 factor (ECF subfamily)